MGEHLAGVPSEQHEELVLDGSEPKLLVSAEHLAAYEVKLEISQTELHTALEPLRDDILARLAERIGLRLATALRDGFGEVGEEDKSQRATARMKTG